MVGAASGMPDTAGRVIDSVLNLNAESLCESRKQLMSEYLKSYNRNETTHRGLSSAQKRAVARKIRDASEIPGTAFPSTLLAIAEAIEAKA